MCVDDQIYAVGRPLMTKIWDTFSECDSRVLTAWKMKVVMEKSWIMKKWQNVMTFWDQSWNFTHFPD